jgi:ATP-dependent Lhr-like helicase
MALEAAWQERFGEQPEVFVANESVVVQLAHDLNANDILEMVPEHKLEDLLRQRLEGSGFFGARFRENAGRSLLLSKGKFNERKPLWMSRLQSQKLMDSVMKYEDFPILLETWRTCLQDEFDIDNLRLVLGELATGETTVSEIETATPSPFAQSVAWGQVNTYMYMSDSPKSNKTSNLSQTLLEEVVFSPGLRPSLDKALIAPFVNQRQRRLKGYAPADNEDLEDWVKERSVIPMEEWELLCASLSFEPDEDRFRAIGPLVVSVDDETRVREILSSPDTVAEQDIETLTANWLQYYGPVTANFVANQLTLGTDDLTPRLESLVDSNVLVSGELLADDSSHYFCDAANYEYLLRMQRASHRPRIEARPLPLITSFMHAWQSSYSTGDPLDCLFECIDRLRGLPLSAALWESEVLPCRLPDYRSSNLDLLFQEGELQWLGLGEKTVTFSFADDTDLFFDNESELPESTLLTDEFARYDFTGLLDKTGLGSEQLADNLWEEVWQSLISNNTMTALRKSIQNQFKTESITDSRRGRRGNFSRWQGSMPLSGNWYRVIRRRDELDLLEAQELEKDRARMMLNRYGIVFRELCARESSAVKWQRIFRALRLMELSGEVVSGHFFEQIPGPQFMTLTSLRFLQAHKGESAFFISAADPVSPSGLGFGLYGDQLPRRLPSNHLAFLGEQLILTSARNGELLQFLVPPDSPEIDAALSLLHHLAYRSFEPVRQLRIETINDEPAANSDYRAAIDARFNTFSDYKSIVLQREL